VSEQKVYLSDLIGTPFKFQETDCWWLAREVFRRFGIDIPEYAVSRKIFNCNLKNMPKIIEEKTDWAEHAIPRIPCMIAMQFGLPFYHHIGVYIGNNKFIHTSKVRGGVTIESLDNVIYAKRKFYTFNGN